MKNNISLSRLIAVVAVSVLLVTIPSHAETPVSFTQGVKPGEVAAKAFEQGVQLGLTKTPDAAFSVKFADVSTGMSPDSATLKALAEGEEPAPFVVYWSTNDLAAVAPFLNQSEIVGLIAWNVNKKTIALGTKIFGFGYSDLLSFKALTKFAGDRLKSYRFGMISSAAAPFDYQSEVFSEETKSLGNTIVFNEKVDSTTDFAALVKRAQKETCDTIFAALPGAELISLIKAARAASYKGKILVGDTLFASEVAALGKDAEGVYAVQAWSDDAAFKASYVAQYPGTPDGVTLGAAALGYDLVNCVHKVGMPLDSSAIRSSFLSGPCEGLTGITQFTGERISQRRKRILTVKDGQFALAE